MNATDLQKSLEEAAKAIQNAKALVITAGAGIGVDSGLPDYRGDDGFWRAYPPLRERGLTFSDVCTPEWLERDPNFGWWFFSHQIELYRRTQPHAGFGILREWAERKPNGYFVFTSNVDGHFEKAGFDAARIVECHGSIHYMQCTDPKMSREVWQVPADFHLDIDPKTLRAKPPLPVGPPTFEESKRVLSRPNVLMNKDWLTWIGDRTSDQMRRYQIFLSQLDEKKEPFTIIEFGAGKGIPTVRIESEIVCAERAPGFGTLIRVNPADSDAPTHVAELDCSRCISLPLGALEAITRLKALIDTRATAAADARTSKPAEALSSQSNSRVLKT